MCTLQRIEKAAAGCIEIKCHHMLFIQTQLFLNQTGRCRGCLIGRKGRRYNQVDFLWINAGCLDCHAGSPCTQITRIFLFRYIPCADSCSCGYPFITGIDKGAQLLIGNTAFCLRIPKALNATALHNSPPLLYIFHTAVLTAFSLSFYTIHQEPVPYCHAAAQSHIQSIHAHRPVALK